MYFFCLVATDCTNLKIILHVFVLFWFYLSSWPPSKSGSCESNKHDDLMQWWQHPFYALFYNTLFRKYRFILDELLMRVASKFAITFGGRWKHNFQVLSLHYIHSSYTFFPPKRQVIRAEQTDKLLFTSLLILEMVSLKFSSKNF